MHVQQQIQPPTCRPQHATSLVCPRTTHTHTSPTQHTGLNSVTASQQLSVLKAIPTLLSLPRKSLQASSSLPHACSAHSCPHPLPLQVCFAGRARCVCVCDPSPLSPCRPLNHTHNPTCSTSHHTPHPPTKTQHNTLAQSRHCRNSCRCSQGHTRNMLALPTHPRLLLFQQGILSAAKAASNPHTPTKPCAPFLRPSPSVQSTIYLLACSAFQRLMAGPWCVCILTSDAGTAQHSAT